MIRQAAEADWPRIADMAARFHAEVKPPYLWDRDAFLSLCKRAGFLSVSDRGFLMGVLAPNLISPKWLQAHELLWWSEDGTGAAHMNAFRQWAKDQGAHEVVWSCQQDNTRVMRLLGRVGRPTDASFSEVLRCA